MKRWIYRSILFLMICALLLLSACDSQPNYNYVTCTSCFKEVPERFMSLNFEEDKVCSDCIGEMIESISSGQCGVCHECGSYYYAIESFGLGLCADCGEHVVVDCNMCMRPTRQWSESNDFALCPQCMGYAIENSDIENILRSLYE